MSSPAYRDADGPALDFRPLPLLSNPHVQTVLGLYLPGNRFRHPTREHVLRLPDGDALMLHDSTPPGWPPGGRIALLLHGLTGSHASPVVRRVAARLYERGLRVVRLDLRGAGKGLPLARVGYNAARSPDVRAALHEVHRWSPASPLVLVGFSLGGALALRTAGEAAEHPLPGLERVLAVGPPLDLVRCVHMLERPGNRMYQSHFASLLAREAQLRQTYFPDLPPLSLPRRLTVRQFDDLYTAPRCGFADAWDYYRRASSQHLVPHVRVPTLILTARDDPFIAVEPFEELRAKVPAHVTVRVLSHGGHLGFLGWDGAGGIRWIDRRIVDWVTQPLDPVEPPRKG
jgi:uncharacterized protein